MLFSIQQLQNNDTARNWREQLKYQLLRRSQLIRDVSNHRRVPPTLYSNFRCSHCSYLLFRLIDCSTADGCSGNLRRAERVVACFVQDGEKLYNCFLCHMTRTLGIHRWLVQWEAHRPGHLWFHIKSREINWCDWFERCSSYICYMRNDWELYKNGWTKPLFTFAKIIYTNRWYNRVFVIT